MKKKKSWVFYISMTLIFLFFIFLVIDSVLVRKISLTSEEWDAVDD